MEKEQNQRILESGVPHKMPKKHLMVSSITRLNEQSDPNCR